MSQKESTSTTWKRNYDDGSGSRVEIEASDEENDLNPLKIRQGDTEILIGREDLKWFFDTMLTAEEIIF